MSDFETNPKELKKVLLSQIDDCEMALPDFQRDFVWQPGQTRSLIVSLAKGFPAGSLLTIESGDKMFEARAFAGAPELNGKRPKYLVLDGQQRLTSLYQALYGTGEHLYFFSFKKYLETEDIEEAIIYERRDRGEKYYDTLENQAKYGVLPLQVIFGGKGYHKWVRDIQNEIEKRETDGKQVGFINSQIDEIDEIYEMYIEPIEAYKFPVVTLPDTTSLEAVCTIFETLNSTGVRLSVFDLLAARFFSQKENLRQMWSDALTETKHLEEFEIDPYYILQVVSANVKNSIKRSDVLKLTPEEVVENWERSINGMDNALEMLQEECGVLKRGLLSYNTILIPLAAAFVLHDYLSGPAKGKFRERIQRWYWCSVFGQAYESSPSSQTIRDINEIRAWMTNDKEPINVNEFEFERDRLLRATTRQRAIYRGILGLTLRAKPYDFHSKQPLTLGIMEQNHVDDHHIFPNKYLQDTKQYEQVEIDAIVNRTLIDRETNQRIGKRPPSNYLSEIAEEWADDQLLSKVLSSHYLPTEKDSSLFTDNYEDFRQQRADVLYKLILDATTGS